MTYLTIDSIVKQSDAELSAAEAHGMASGMLCADENCQSEDWLAELLRHAAPASDEGRAILTNLFQETRNLLASDEFEFDLLLPDEDEALLSERVEALTGWCRGFLMGLSVNRNAPDRSRDVAEILKDITEFTKLDTEAEGEEDEGDFIEITEYLRSAVMLLRSEFNTDGD